ncbi:MAG TPA: hypothetical protein VIT85_04355 [Solirubrobacterales bacterium]
MLAGFLLALAALSGALLGRGVEPASALEDRVGPVTVIEEPAYVAPLSIGVFGPRPRGDRPNGVTAGHWFKFSFANNCGSEKRLNSVRLEERPKTKARPFKSAVIYATAEIPAKKRSYGADGIEYGVACTMEFRWTSEKVRTKRPARKLIFFDGSSEPPRRIWPPVGTPPEK